MKTRILSAALPPGGTVDEQEIAASLGISRTPVREALRKLEQEGLVVRYPNRGAVVTQLSMKEVVEIWQIREILEPAACHLAAARIDPAALADLTDLEKAIAELSILGPGFEDYEAHNRSDLDLHRLVLGGAGNATLLAVVEALDARVRQARSVNSPSRFRESVAEHQEIIAALKAGDGPGAAAAMSRHLANARTSLSRLG